MLPPGRGRTPLRLPRALFRVVSGRLAELDADLARKRIVVAHLGSGASLCAMRAGASVATTMGFTTPDGLMMATRCGSLDV